MKFSWLRKNLARAAARYGRPVTGAMSYQALVTAGCRGGTVPGTTVGTVTSISLKHNLTSLTSFLGTPNSMKIFYNTSLLN
jgi:hypothetical protein